MGALIISALLVFMAAPLCFICARSYIKLGSSSGDDPSGMVGLIAEAQVNFCEQGSVLARGELWQARSARGIVRKGERVRVVGVEKGLILVVEGLNS